MGEHKVSAFVFCLIVQLAVMLVCGHFLPTAASGGLIPLTTVPTSFWGDFTTGGAVLFDSMTFTLTGFGILGIFMWLLVIVELLCVVLIIRGTD